MRCCSTNTIRGRYPQVRNPQSGAE